MSLLKNPIIFQIDDFRLVFDIYIAIMEFLMNNFQPVNNQNVFNVKLSMILKLFVISKLADFWYSGVFGHEKSIGASPEFQKNFFDPLWGYPMLKNQFFQHFYFGSKLVDFWYSGVFGHEKSIGAGLGFQKNFFDPLWGLKVCTGQAGPRAGLA